MPMQNKSADEFCEKCMKKDCEIVFFVNRQVDTVDIYYTYNLDISVRQKHNKKEKVNQEVIR